MGILHMHTLKYTGSHDVFTVEFSDVEINVVSAKKYATEAVQDIVDAIRALKPKE